MIYVTKAFDDKVVELLEQGKVGLLPSDTIYGLSCRALDRSAVERLHRIKRRDKNKPFIILFSTLDELEMMGVKTVDAARAMRYWPGKLSLICDAPYAPDWLQMSTKTLAVRQPAWTELRELIDKTGPIISTSANLENGQTAATISQAKEYFGKKLDFYVDAGRLGGPPSTLVKPVFTKLDVVRPGAVKIRQEDLALQNFSS